MVTNHKPPHAEKQKPEKAEEIVTRWVMRRRPLRVILILIAAIGVAHSAYETLKPVSEWAEKRIVRWIGLAPSRPFITKNGNAYQAGQQAGIIRLDMDEIIYRGIPVSDQKAKTDEMAGSLRMMIQSENVLGYHEDLPNLKNGADANSSFKDQNYKDLAFLLKGKAADSELMLLAFLAHQNEFLAIDFYGFGKEISKLQETEANMNWDFDHEVPGTQAGLTLNETKAFETVLSDYKKLESEVEYRIPKLQIRMTDRRTATEDLDNFLGKWEEYFTNL